MTPSQLLWSAKVALARAEKAQRRAAHNTRSQAIQRGKARQRRRAA